MYEGGGGIRAVLMTSGQRPINSSVSTNSPLLSPPLPSSPLYMPRRRPRRLQETEREGQVRPPLRVKFSLSAEWHHHA